MPVPLRTVLATSDAHFKARRMAHARAGYEVLLERAQAEGDRPMQVIAHTMLGRLYLQRRDLDRVRAELSAAARLADDRHRESITRLRAAEARLARLAESPEAAKAALRAYLAWAERVEAHFEVLDACMLLSEDAAGEEAIGWLRRAIDHGLTVEVHEALGHLYDALAACFERSGDFDNALESYQQALHWHRRHGTPRQVVAALWAGGATAARLGQHALARGALQDAAAAAEDHGGCADLLALALADLALVHEATGDVEGARQLVQRGVLIAIEQDLRSLWPERWDALRRHAHRLDAYSVSPRQ